MQFVPYLNFDGTCAEAFKFYAEVTGGELVAMFGFEAMPGGNELGPEWAGRIMHARLIANGGVLMGSDGMPGQFEAQKGIWVSIQLKDKAEAERIFNAFAEGGSVRMPFAETFFSLGFGMVTDRFGTPWMINCEKPMEEIGG